ncbi:malate dehydrogenase [Talaromyces proteolyticus]|uniref:Malate dehydrogenase n=1 Tax=Talaromyces proteolyticus TaxID=1131652 RepID=A0AAD4KVY7_9EURO|nr:malate dehydrogenase [Talaromyces proteolyticus]KAH8697896.1 malate dehydrogenase [Talaromyces proteolyticus]
MIQNGKMTNKTFIPPSKTTSFATSLLQSASLSAEHAAVISSALTLADLRGVDTHGLNRLPGYLVRIKTGALNPNPSFKFNAKTPVCALLDAQNTFGFLAAHAAVEYACGVAETYGVGIVGVKNSGHYGMAATYLLQAFERGMGCMAFTNASRSMPAWGSKEALLGTSPFAVGLPPGSKERAKGGRGWVLDMSPAVVARGKIRKAARHGESIPEGWALDATGSPTTDPNAALADGAVVLPIGGPKGSGLAMMMDIFGGLLTGASFAGDVNDQYKVADQPQGVGHWFMVFRPDVFLDGGDNGSEGMEEYKLRMDKLFDRVRNSEKAAGVQRIYTSGEIEDEVEKNRREEGIPFTSSEIDTLNRIAEEWGSQERLP